MSGCVLCLQKAAFLLQAKCHRCRFLTAHAPTPHLPCPSLPPLPRSVTPVRDASGRLLSFIGVQSDITELVRRRQAEKELKVGAGAGWGGMVGCVQWWAWALVPMQIHRSLN